MVAAVQGDSGMFRHMVANVMRPAFRPAFATRGMATKLIVSVTGPANQMALSNFTRTIQGQGANLGGSRSMEVSGTVSISSVVFLKSGGDQVNRTADLTWALQTSMQGYIVSARPALPVSACPAFARVTVTGAERMGILAELADHLDSRSVQVSTMRTFTDASRYGADGIEGTDDDEDPLYTCVATLASFDPKNDSLWIEKELYEFADKADLHVVFERLEGDE